MSNPLATCGQGTNISATTTLVKGDGVLVGIFVSSASNTPTITVYDDTTNSSTKLIDTFTPVAATYYPINAQFSAGLTVAISGTVSCTPVYR